MGILSSRQRFGAAAFLLALSALLSRFMGLARDKIISWQFGAGSEADMYFAAFVVPDIINYLLAGSFMSITIIPLLAKAFEKGEDEAWSFYSCVFCWMATASTCLALVGEIQAHSLARLIAPGFSADQITRLAFFMRLILPAQIFFLTGSCFTALLLLRRQFVVPGLTPLIYNGCIILCGLALPLIPGLPQDFGMTGYCIGVTIGAVLGAFGLPLLIAFKGGLHTQLRWHHPWLKRFLAIALPLMLGQTVVMLDEQFLRVFGSMLGEGGVSLLNYGRRIAQVPVALMGQAIAAASYPFLVKLLAQNETGLFDQTLRQALAAALGLIIPCAILMAICSQPILGIIFQGGRFSLTDTLACVPITRIMLAATPFWILYMVVVRGFYARGDTLTPAITGTIITILCIPVYYILAVPLGAWAIAAISGLGVACYAVWMTLIWSKRHGSSAFAHLPSLCLKCSFFSVPGAIIAWFFTNGDIPTLPSRFSLWGMVLRLGTASVAFCACFIGTGLLFDRKLVKSLWQTIRKRK